MLAFISKERCVMKGAPKRSKLASQLGGSFMPSSSAPVRVVHFGVFEVDLRSGELRKAGTRIKLHDQPFQVLAMLLDRPGELVTREAIRLKLWPGDTFVDFDHGLNNAVNRLRDALGDSAEPTPQLLAISAPGTQAIFKAYPLPVDLSPTNVQCRPVCPFG